MYAPHAHLWVVWLLLSWWWFISVAKGNMKKTIRSVRQLLVDLPSFLHRLWWWPLNETVTIERKGHSTVWWSTTTSGGSWHSSLDVLDKIGVALAKPVGAPHESNAWLPDVIQRNGEYWLAERTWFLKLSTCWSLMWSSLKTVCLRFTTSWHKLLQPSCSLLGATTVLGWCSTKRRALQSAVW